MSIIFALTILLLGIYPKNNYRCVLWCASRDGQHSILCNSTNSNQLHSKWGTDHSRELRCKANSHSNLILKNRSSTGKKPRTQHIHQVIKVNAPTNKSSGQPKPPDRKHWEGNSITSDKKQIHNLNRIMRKQEINPNWGTFCRVTVQPPQKCQGHKKDKEKTKELSARRGLRRQK